MTAAERLVLRTWTTDPGDVAFLYDMYSRHEVRRYVGDGSLMSDPAEARAMVGRWARVADGVLGIRAVCTPGGERLGSILLKDIPWSADTREASERVPLDVEIGWHLHPDAWGRGVARRAAALVLDDAWRGGITRVVAVTNPANTRSQRVCRSIGMTHLGQTTRYYDTVCELFEATAP